MQPVEEVLKQRGNKYGEFVDNAALTQDLEDVLRKHPGWAKLAPDQKECFGMIFHKISRCMNGDPKYDDNFIDIAGYATLVAKRLTAEAKAIAEPLFIEET